MTPRSGRSRPAIMLISELLPAPDARSEEHTSELQSLRQLVCRRLLEKKKGVLGRRRGDLADQVGGSRGGGTLARRARNAGRPLDGLDHRVARNSTAVRV